MLDEGPTGSIGWDTQVWLFMHLGFLPTWWLDSKAKHLERESQVEAEVLLEPSSGSHQCHFCHVLFVSRESLNPTHVQGKENYTPLFFNRHILNPPHSLKQKPRESGIAI